MLRTIAQTQGPVNGREAPQVLHPGLDVRSVILTCFLKAGRKGAATPGCAVLGRVRGEVRVRREIASKTAAPGWGSVRAVVCCARPEVCACRCLLRGMWVTTSWQPGSTSPDSSNARSPSVSSDALTAHGAPPILDIQPLSCISCVRRRGQLRGPESTRTRRSRSRDLGYRAASCVGRWRSRVCARCSDNNAPTGRQGGEGKGGSVGSLRAQ